MTIFFLIATLFKMEIVQNLLKKGSKTMDKQNLNEFNGNGFKENAVEWITGDESVSVTLSQKKYISKIEKLAQKYPEDVKIVARNEDGTIFAHLPLSYLKISRPKQMSDEQREAARERFKKMWDNKGRDKDD